MNFSPELAQKVIDGQKTVTRRMPKIVPNLKPEGWDGRKDGMEVLPCRYVVGRDYAVCPGRGKHAIGRILIKSTRLEPLKLALVKPEPYLEGFSLPEGFKRVWESMHGSFDPEQLVWRVAFEVVRDG